MKLTLLNRLFSSKKANVVEIPASTTPPHKCSVAVPASVVTAFHPPIINRVPESVSEGYGPKFGRGVSPSLVVVDEYKTDNWPAPKVVPNDYIQKAFEKFHADNPYVYRTLVDLAKTAKANGHKRVGIGLLWERMRWYYTMENKGGIKFRLNNNFRSRYARIIMQNEPSLAGFFNTRELY